MNILKDFLKHFTNESKLNLYASSAPNNAKMPYAIYTLISINDDISINARQMGAHTRHYYIQLDIYAKTYADLLEKSANARAAIYSFKNPIQDFSESHTSDELSHRAILEFDFIE